MSAHHSNERYLCPICDLELKGTHTYCRNCHSFVAQPIIYTGGYLPNESDCSGCMETYERPAMTRQQMSRPVAHRDDISYSRKGNSEWQESPKRGGKTYSANPKKEKKKGGIGWIVFLIFIILMELFTD